MSISFKYIVYYVGSDAWTVVVCVVSIFVCCDIEKLLLVVMISTWLVVQQ